MEIQELYEKLKSSPVPTLAKSTGDFMQYEALLAGLASRAAQGEKIKEKIPKPDEEILNRFDELASKTERTQEEEDFLSYFGLLQKIEMALLKSRMKTVVLDATKITDWEALHDIFYEAFGFPGYYGRNMNAWIDCMTNLDTDMNKVKVESGEILVLQLENAGEFKKNQPELYMAIIEAAGFVNWRRMEVGQPAIICLSFYS